MSTKRFSEYYGLSHTIGGAACRSLAAGAVLSWWLTAACQAQCTGFNLSSSSGATVDPGTVDIQNHCDDCVTPVALPFPFTVYGVSYTSVNACSNGTLQFTTSNNAYNNICLPDGATLGVAMCPQWDDLRTDGTNGEGIYTSVTGTAPNRVFNIEWRARYYSGGGVSNFEVRLFENNSRAEFVYGTIDQGGSGSTIGIQHPVYPSTQYSCNTTGLTPGTRLSFTCTNGAIPPTGVASTNPSSVNACGDGGVSLFTVNVVPGLNPPSTGIAVTTNLSSVGGTPAQVMYDDGTHGDVTAGDRIYSLRVVVPSTTTPGAKVLPFSITDAQGRSSAGAFNLTVSPCPASGPDVFVARLTDVGYYGSVGAITAYSIGTDACNNGDLPVTWIQAGVQHPVIAQNMYRLKNGRFEQIGQSWLKHGFSSTNSTTCGACTTPPMGSQQLGVGCSDAYGAGLNGGQGFLGPRSEVNPTTGAFIWPHGTGDASAIGMRLQVLTSDIDPTQNAGAQYFGECQYITSDDARWTLGVNPAINGLNNVTYQPISFANTTSAPSLTGTVHRMSPAILAWKDADPSVTMVPVDYVDTSLGAPGIVARFWVGAKASDNHDGTWHYEYAVYNLNADRACGGFEVPISDGIRVSNIGFKGPFAHSGEPYPNTAANPDSWPAVVSGGQIRWSTPEAYQPPSGSNANALRWGTLYNFRFDADIAPDSGNGRLSLFKPGTLQSLVTGTITVPGVPPCPADFNRDGGVDGADVDAFFMVWEDGAPAADFNQDGGVDGADIQDFFARWEGGC